MKRFTVFLGAFLLAAVAQAQTSNTKMFRFSERAFGEVDVPVELTIPATGTAPYPVIISQHGSERDGKTFAGGAGKTDEYTTRLIQRAAARGYAVMAIDAFHNKGLEANDKLRFPTASVYAESLRQKVSEFPDLDDKNVFYTGFSYGARSVLNELRSAMQAEQWRALAAAEPDCNTFAAPTQIKTAVLIMKGGESHYPPKPCEIMAKMHSDTGNNVSTKLFPKSNHYFSHNGRIVKGKAYNGCSDDPIVIYTRRGPFKTASGKPVSIEELRAGRCFTATGGTGKSREDLNDAVDTALDFFDKHRTK
jgi:dienelactone hydrolase